MVYNAKMGAARIAQKLYPHSQLVKSRVSLVFQICAFHLQQLHTFIRTNFWQYSTICCQAVAVANRWKLVKPDELPARWCWVCTAARVRSTWTDSYCMDWVEQCQSQLQQFHQLIQMRADCCSNLWPEQPQGLLSHRAGWCRRAGYGHLQKDSFCPLTRCTRSLTKAPSGVGKAGCEG